MQSFCLLFFQILQSIATKETEAYGLAGAVAEEVLSAIRIVAAYAGEAKEVMRYEENLKTARSVGIMKGLVSGLGQGLVWIIAFGVIGLAFWYGGELVRDEDIMYTAGIVLQVRLICMYNYSKLFKLIHFTLPLLCSDPIRHVCGNAKPGLVSQCSRGNFRRPRRCCRRLQDYRCRKKFTFC